MHCYFTVIDFKSYAYSYVSQVATMNSGTVGIGVVDPESLKPIQIFAESGYGRRFFDKNLNNLQLEKIKF